MKSGWQNVNLRPPGLSGSPQEVFNKNSVRKKNIVSVSWQDCTPLSWLIVQWREHSPSLIHILFVWNQKCVSVTPWAKIGECRAQPDRSRGGMGRCHAGVRLHATTCLHDEGSVQRTGFYSCICKMRHLFHLQLKHLWGGMQPVSTDVGVPSLQPGEEGVIAVQIIAPQTPGIVQNIYIYIRYIVILKILVLYHIGFLAFIK